MDVIWTTTGAHPLVDLVDRERLAGRRKRRRLGGALDGHLAHGDGALAVEAADGVGASEGESSAGRARGRDGDVGDEATGFVHAGVLPTEA